MGLPRPRLTYANVVSTACLALLLGGTALATDSVTSAQSSAQIYVCVKKRGSTKGQMRIVSQRTRCKRTERKSQWAVEGPAGPAGVAGAPGAAGDALPGGAIAFFAAADCPAGWAPYEPARGRYVVGTPGGGAPEAGVGTPLADQENRAVGQHDHGVTDPGHRHQILRVSPIIRAGNVIPTRIQGTQSQSLATDLPNNVGQEIVSSQTTGVSVNSAGAVPGTNAPYVQLLACRKG